MKEWIKVIIEGLSIGVDWQYKCAFNRKVPKGICWLMTILLLPINLIIILIGDKFNKHMLNDMYEEIITDIEKIEAE